MSGWWQSPFQTTVDAFYLGAFDSGRSACERLFSVDGLPESIDLQVRRNAVFYTRPLIEIAPSATHRLIEIPVAAGWSRFNPSIAADPDGDGLHVVVRSSNYSLSRQLGYSTNDDSGVIRTSNVLVALTSQLDILDVQPIDDAAFRLDPPPFPVSGFEDCRLFWHRGAWWVSATVRDRDAKGICQIAMLRLDAAELHLLSDGASRHEKNWMPAAGAEDGLLRFVYTCYPTVITRFDDASGAVVPELIQPAPLVARRFSGGSQAIPLDGGRLCLVHEAVNFDDGGRVYTHRWVWFDPEWRLSRLSPPFLLQERGIEFAGGLAQRGDDLVISYGVWDRDAWLATVPIAEVLPLLAPPLDPDETEAEMRAAAGSATPSPRAAAQEYGSTEAPPILDAEFVPIREASDASAGITPFAANNVSIVSTTLTGNSEAIIGDALRSVVDWVDRVLVVDTGVSDDTLRIARDIAGAKLFLRSFPWRDDFAAARNFALDAAAELGADWAVTLDTDERIDLNGLDIRAALADTDAAALHVKHAAGAYGKERFFRLPARGHYVGPTHEAFIKTAGESLTLDDIIFDELGKSREQYRQKAERDVAILSRHTAAHPDDPRWHYYLGDSLAGLDRYDEAIAAFRRCASLNGWDEEGGWAMYRAAECLLKLDRPVEAVAACAEGLAKHAGLAELPWLAAYASWHAGRPVQATYWARQAVAMGHFAGAGGEVPRIGFRHPPALWEGPFDVLRFSLRAMGDDAAANEAQRLHEEAKAARMGEAAPAGNATPLQHSAGPKRGLQRATHDAPAEWRDVLSGAAFLINLDRCPERKAASCIELERAGFRNVERIAAIDGLAPSQLSAAWQELGDLAIDPRDAAFSSSLGRQGCFLSHLFVWKRIVADAERFACVFEDDIVLHRDWQSLAPLFYAATPKDFDVLFMGARIEEPSDDPVQPRPNFSTNAYVITGKGAEKLMGLVLGEHAGVSTLDVMINTIQKRSLRQADDTNRFRWYVWNASAFPDPKREAFPSIADRNLGLVFQNGLFGSEVDGWKAH